MKINELRKMTADEINAELKKRKLELFKLRFQLKTMQLKKTDRVKETKKLIAQILTIITEKQKENENMDKVEKVG